MSVLVAVFLRTEIIIDAIVAVKSETQAVLVVVEILISSVETIISGSNMIIFASKTIKSGREAIWFESDMIIFVPAIFFCALDMIIFGRKKISSPRNTINLLPEKMIVITEPIVSVRNTNCSRTVSTACSIESGWALGMPAPWRFLPSARRSWPA
jgi:hypothetical protein